MNLERFHTLPASLEPQELRPLFEELVRMPVTSTKDAVDVARALHELADLQWHNYDLIAPDLAESVTEWAESHWNPQSFDLVVNIVSIALHLGLARVYSLIVACMRETLKPEIRNHLNKVIADVGDNFADPYAGMKSAAPTRKREK
jgi:hypothetical protein